MLQLQPGCKEAKPSGFGGGGLLFAKEAASTPAPDPAGAQGPGAEQPSSRAAAARTDHPSPPRALPSRASGLATTAPRAPGWGGVGWRGPHAGRAGEHAPPKRPPPWPRAGEVGEWGGGDSEPYPADGGPAAARGGPGAEHRGGLALLVAGEVGRPLAVGARGERRRRGRGRSRRRPVARREVLQVELHVDVLALLAGRERHVVGDQLALQLVFGQDRGVLQELRHLRARPTRTPLPGPLLQSCPLARCWPRALRRRRRRLAGEEEEEKRGSLAGSNAARGAAHPSRDTKAPGARRASKCGQSPEPAASLSRHTHTRVHTHTCVYVCMCVIYNSGLQTVAQLVQQCLHTNESPRMQ